MNIDRYGRLTSGKLLLLDSTLPVIPPLPEGMNKKRSKDWPKFLYALLLKFPDCLGCGRKAVTGHHDKPFHLFPQLELVEANVVPVCLPCHFVICHGGDWKLWVKDVRPLLASHHEVVKAAIALLKKGESAWDLGV
jgi:hypothetical protein